MKILLIQLYQTGDVVLTTHLPREIKKIYADAEVDFLTFSANKAVLENNPFIENIITINRDDSFLTFLKSISDIRKSKYDAVLDAHNNPRSGYITFFSGAKLRIGYSTTKRKFFYNRLPERLRGKAGQIKLSLLQPLVKDFRMEIFDYKPAVFTSESAEKKADSVLSGFGIKKDDFFVTMSPTHKKATRRWRAGHFYDTAKYLTENYNAKIILTYGPGEKEYILENFPRLPENVFLMPELSLGEFAALIGRAGLHIGNDSAPHHIATAQNVPTFIILGSSNTGWVYGSPEHTYAELGMDCQPCGKNRCLISDEIPCMKDLSFEMIKGSLDEFINKIVLKDSPDII